MKNLSLLLLIALPLFAFAQNKVGKVYYTENMKLNIEFPEGIDEEMKKMIPQSQATEKVLYFNESASLYTNVNEDDENGVIESSNDDGTMQTKMIVMRADNQYFRDLKKNKTVEKKDIFGKAFIIEKETETPPWKLTGKQKKIGKYVCQQAMYTKDTTTVEAWFTTQVLISAGPSGFDGLPGLVLEVTTRDGDFVIRANKVMLEAIDESKLVAPTKGKKVSQKQFDKILAAKMEEQGAERSGGTFEFRVNRN